MKKLVRSRVTGRFLTTAGKWTDLVSEAWQCEDIIEAITTTQGLPFKDVEIYYLFQAGEPSRYDFAVRVC